MRHSVAPVWRSSSNFAFPLRESRIGTMLSPMRVIARSAIREFLDSHSTYADSKEPLEAWFHHTRKADWSTPAGLKQELRHASILQDGRVVFNIAGNKYRLVAQINYKQQIVYIRFIGTHKQYDEINAQTV